MSLDSADKLGSRRAPRLIAICSLAFYLLVATAAGRADNGEQGAQEALETGEIVPLQRILAKLREDFDGHVLKVDLEHEDDTAEREWVYEVKILTPEGNVLKLEYDAKSMELLELKGQHGRRHHDDDD